MSTPAHLFVLSDILGFAGAFSTLEKASAVVREFAPTPFLVHRYEADPAGSRDTAWMVIYQANDAVAFASNNKAVATSVQERYAALGLVYDADISFWEFPLNEIPGGTKLRLEAIKALTSAQAKGVDIHHEKISILTDVVCCIPVRAEVQAEPL